MAAWLPLLAYGGVQQREQVADAGLGEDARDQLHARLRGVVDLHGRGGAGVLQRVGVEPLRLAVDAGAPFAGRVGVCQHREDLAGDRRHGLPVHPARHLGAHDAARARHQEIVERGLGGMRLRHLHPRIDRQIGVVEDRAQQRGLDALDVHHQVGDRAAEEAVGDDHRRHGGERRHVDLHDLGLAVAGEHLALVAPGGHPVEGRLVVALVVHAHVVLGDLDLPVDLVDAFVAAGRQMLVDGVARQLLRIAQHRVAGDRLDLVAVVAVGDQVLLAPDDLVEAVAAVAQRAGEARDAELLRRHALHARLRHRLAGDDGDVVEHRNGRVVSARLLAGAERPAPARPARARPARARQAGRRRRPGRAVPQPARRQLRATSRPAGTRDRAARCAPRSRYRDRPPARRTHRRADPDRSRGSPPRAPPTTP